MLTLLLAVSKTQAVPTQFSLARAAFNLFLSGIVCLDVTWLPQCQNSNQICKLNYFVV